MLAGFYHEPSRPHREYRTSGSEFIFIFIAFQRLDLILGLYNFNEFEWSRTVLQQNTPYDLQSIMDYGAYAFSNDGQPTILPRRSNLQIGQREGLSPIDIAEIRLYYRC